MTSIQREHLQSERPDAPAQARHRLLLRLTADFPTLPPPLIAGAVVESEHLIRLAGDGETERETVEIVARHNLALVLAAICAANAAQVRREIGSQTG